MTRRNLDGVDGIDEAAWNRLMERAPRRRRATPATVPMKPVTLDEIAAEYWRALEGK